jgi:hypothetical protein
MLIMILIMILLVAALAGATASARRRAPALGCKTQENLSAPAA